MRQSARRIPETGKALPTYKLLDIKVLLDTATASSDNSPPTIFMVDINAQGLAAGIISIDSFLLNAELS